MNFTAHATAPDDITPIGQEFNVNKQLEKLKSIKFPKTDGRRFQLQWLQRYDWIEYSISRDAVFCSTCRQFGPISQDRTFTVTGYNTWQSALTSGRGFARHDASSVHIGATFQKSEKEKRALSGKSISNLVNTTVYDKRRYY